MIHILIYISMHLVDGNWGDWADFGTCSVTCGGGQQQRTRLCNNPSAKFGGLACLLTGSTVKRANQETETKKCNEQKCQGKRCFLSYRWGLISSFKFHRVLNQCCLNLYRVI